MVEKLRDTFSLYSFKLSLSENVFEVNAVVNNDFHILRYMQKLCTMNCFWKETDTFLFELHVN
jgi:hypothetical protein